LHNNIFCSVSKKLIRECPQYQYGIMSSHGFSTTSLISDLVQR